MALGKIVAYSIRPLIWRKTQMLFMTVGANELSLKSYHDVLPKLIFICSNEQSLFLEI